MTTRQGGLTSRGGESDHHDWAFKLDQGLAAKLTRRWGAGGIVAGVTAARLTQRKREGSNAGDRLPLPQRTPQGH